MPTVPLAPVAFLGHGNPMNTLERNRYTDAWRRFGESCGAPRAVLVVSAHWFINATAVTAMSRPRTIHDFYGFPRELSEFLYPAPGSPELADEVADLARPDLIGRDETTWGLDHGTWSVLAHVFPRADVPVVQLSINALKPFDYHVELARRLAPLRERGVVIIGSGNLVHNLYRIDWSLPANGFDWARDFDAKAKAAMLEAPGSVADLASDEGFRLAAPTPDHFVPLLYVAALADVAGCAPAVLVDGLEYGSISMTAFALGAPVETAETRGTTGPSMPDPAVTPPDQTNI